MKSMFALITIASIATTLSLAIAQEKPQTQEMMEEREMMMKSDTQHEKCPDMEKRIIIRQGEPGMMGEGMMSPGMHMGMAPLFGGLGIAFTVLWLILFAIASFIFSVIFWWVHNWMAKK